MPVIGDASADALGERGRVVVGRPAAECADPQLAALRSQHVRRGAAAAFAAGVMKKKTINSNKKNIENNHSKFKSRVRAIGTYIMAN